MSDAKVKQSIERCEYGHDWDGATPGRGDYVFTLEHRPFCKRCGFKPTEDSRGWHEAEAILYLRKVLKPGNTVYTVLRRVSRSGMSRNIDLYYMAKNEPVWISSSVGHAIGSPQSRKNWDNSQGLTVSGCGMDMGYHLVYSLSRVLFPDGFKGAMSGQHQQDGGYALKQRWL